MTSVSRICAVCGIVNQRSETHCPNCGQRLSITNTEIESNTTATAFLQPNTLLKQRYLVMHAVGKGGMGTVYIGKDTHLGNRLVAIKVMSQSKLSPLERLLAAKNFKREAYLLAELQHPHLPSIYDHFEENQRWYLVMSFIKGQTLADYLEMKNGRLPVEEVLEIGIALCTVLTYLHTHQPPIIFRDLKPSNIMRTRDGHIYLIDFGVARLFKPEQLKDTTNRGTSGYAPPEQYGTTQTTPRSDIYSLGATLYHLISGHNPAKTPLLLPPLQSLVPTAPTPLVALITQMLNLEEEERPKSTEIVKQELQNIASSSHSTSLPPATIAPTSSDSTLSLYKPAISSNSNPVPPAPVISSSPNVTPPALAIASSFNATPPLSVPQRKRKRIVTISISSAVLIILVILYLLSMKENPSNLNSHASSLSDSNSPHLDTPYAVVKTFCNAMNSQYPDFQTAYQQLSGNYQRNHPLPQFQKDLQGTTQCVVSSAPDEKNEAEIYLVIMCPPPPNGPPNGPPPSNGPPPQGPPSTKNPVDLTLIKDGNNGWKIDTVTLVRSYCGPPPNQL